MGDLVKEKATVNPGSIWINIFFPHSLTQLFSLICHPFVCIPVKLKYNCSTVQKWSHEHSPYNAAGAGLEADIPVSNERQCCDYVTTGLLHFHQLAA